MSRCPDRDDLRRYLARQLAPADHAALADHLAACPACRAACAGLPHAPEPTVTLGQPPPLATDDTAPDHIPLADAPTRRLWRKDQAPRPGERPIQAPGLDWSFPTLPTHPTPVIRGYEVLGELGRGGMGIVYKARQVELNRLVALKMILASELADPENLVRFRTEAEAVARLQHPNIVQVYEVGTAQGRPFYSLEYVGGGNLAQHIAAAAPPPVAAAALVETLARAIHYAHERGVIHRDLKPANILLAGVRSQESGVRSQESKDIARSAVSSLTPDSCLLTPKVTDFGLAKYTPAAAAQRPGSPTRPGLVVGTPQYMAPEQADGAGQPIGPTVDVYSLGAILYELLTGRPPFQGATAMDTLLRSRILDPIAPRIWQPKVPPDLETITLKCLQKEPPRRYTSAAALADDLRRFRDGKPITARPAGLSERAWKWIRRHPTVTALGLMTALSTVSGVAGMAWQWGRASARHAAAEVALREAESELYLSRIAQAHLHYQAGHVDRTIAVLDLCRPTADQSDRRQWEWHYLNRLCHPGAGDRALPDPQAHFAKDARFQLDSQLTADGVTYAALSPDGRWLATVSVGKDDTVRIQDAASRALAMTLAGPRQPLAVAFSPNGRRLAVVSSEGALKLWDVAAWQEILSLPAPEALAPTPENWHPRLTFSPDGSIIAARLWEGEIPIWDATPLDDR